MNSSSTSNSDLPVQAPVRTARALAFIAGAIAVVFGLQLVGGVKFDSSDKWMGPVLHGQSPRPYDFYLFGTSRVAAAIDVSVFEKTLADSGVAAHRSVNLGMGYSQISEYYFAARHVLDSRPEAFRGSVVLLEAPMGLPEYATFHDNWMVEDAVNNLAGYLKPSDLPAFLLHSRSTPLSKMQVTGWVLFGFREHFSRLRYHSSNAITQMLTSRKELEAQAGISDLTADGGIRVDSAGVAAVRLIAQAHTRELIKNQVPQREWDSTSLRKFVSLLQDAGARVVLFSIPLAPTQAMPLLTPLRQEDRKALDTTLAAWKVPMLHPNMVTDESDFPDYMHLRRTRAAEFSTKLAITFLERLGKP